MNQNTILTVSLLVAGLVGSYIFGSYYPFTEVLQQKSVVSSPIIPFVQEWRSTVSGDVVEINSESITISSDEQILTVSFANELNISKTIVSNNEPSEIIEDLSVDDIEVGDSVGLGLVSDNKGNIRAHTINFFELSL